MAENVRSEDVLGEKWDRCLTDTAIKLAGGVALGGVFSLLFFKRKVWPVAFGAGLGLGIGYSNCQHDLQSPYVIRGKKVLKETGTT